MVGSNRVVQGKGIVYPLGDAEISKEDEKELRRSIVQDALDALTTEVEDQQ
jgi:betaine reductase